jgi:hypothetical protein
VVWVDVVEPEAWEKTEKQYGRKDSTCNQALWCLAARLVGRCCSSSVVATTTKRARGSRTCACRTATVGTAGFASTWKTTSINVQNIYCSCVSHLLPPPLDPPPLPPPPLRFSKACSGARISGLLMLTARSSRALMSALGTDTAYTVGAARARYVTICDSLMLTLWCDDSPRCWCRAWLLWEPNRCVC